LNLFLEDTKSDKLPTKGGFVQQQANNHQWLLCAL